MTTTRGTQRPWRPCAQCGRITSRPLPHTRCGQCDAEAIKAARLAYNRAYNQRRGPRVRKVNTRRCEVPGCTQPHQAKGMCRYHYERSRRPPPTRPGRNGTARPCVICGYTHRRPLPHARCTFCAHEVV